ncbi:MAG: HutD family protein [Ramlibacter sp.]|nr:HutD family protein [Ramlibacter sp.]
MNWQIVRTADAVPSPWRNGGGVTRELVAWPAAGDWTWRISVAEVAASGPFSRFEGIQRWFAVLDGHGVTLELGGARQTLTPASPPLCFDGAVPVDCRLSGGATRDLNLMVRADRASARMTRIEGSGQWVVRRPGVFAVYAARTPVALTCGGQTLSVPADSLAWRRFAAEARVEVDGELALCMEIAP